MRKKPKIFRITTVPISLKILLSGQLNYVSSFYDVIGISSPGPMLDDIAASGIRTIPVKMTRKITPLADLHAIIKLVRLMRSERPLIVHTHTPKAGAVGMIAAWLAGVPVRLHTVAGMPLLETSGFKRQLLELVEKITYSCAHKVYPNSMNLKHMIVASGLCRKDKISVIGNGSSNGIDSTHFDPGYFDEEFRITLKAQQHIDNKDLVFCFVGRVVAAKGIRELVTAFINIASQRPHVKLLIVGPFEQELDPVDAETIRLLTHHPSIRLISFQDDVRPWLAISDIFVFPSYREGFPNAVMQAGAMGLPCIVSDINGSNEIIVHKINGLIVPVKNTIALEKAMCMLLENKSLFNTLKKHSREMITDRYSQQFVWNQILNEYRGHLEKKKFIQHVPEVIQTPA